MLKMATEILFYLKYLSAFIIGVYCGKHVQAKKLKTKVPFLIFLLGFS